mmetsp:Transcript_14014/g.17656  ORF Transcript_14014/g.17656 Transcript_14014/m.17656 type:complete len:221 (-) Transcript_14014:207-869(-)
MSKWLILFALFCYVYCVPNVSVRTARGSDILQNCEASGAGTATGSSCVEASVTNFNTGVVTQLEPVVRTVVPEVEEMVNTEEAIQIRFSFVYNAPSKSSTYLASNEFKNQLVYLLEEPKACVQVSQLEDEGTRYSVLFWLLECTNSPDAQFQKLSSVSVEQFSSVGFADVTFARELSLPPNSVQTDVFVPVDASDQLQDASSSRMGAGVMFLFWLLFLHV